MISVVEIVEFGVRWTMWTVDDYDDDSYENDVNFDYGDHDERIVMGVRVMRWMMSVGGCCVVSCHC